MKYKWQPKRHQSSASPSSRPLLGRLLSRNDSKGSGSTEDVKGPYGLNTLFNPSEDAIVDLIFVHGLGGGSRSTWSKSPDPEMYWPQKWLPREEGFEGVRIHSFGYNSNWTTGSSLNIHDFAKAFLGCLQDCLAIIRDPNVRFFPISIFIRHR